MINTINIIACKTEKELRAVLQKLEDSGYIWSGTKEKPTKWCCNYPANISVWNDHTIVCCDYSEDKADTLAEDFIGESVSMTRKCVVEVDLVPYTHEKDKNDKCFWVDGVDTFVDAKTLDGMVELDEQYIRENFRKLLEEEYDSGYEDHEQIFKKRSVEHDDESHKNGMEEIFSIIKELFSGTPKERGKILDCEEITFSEIMESMSAEEIMDKYKAYKEKQDAPLKVGDIVKFGSGIGIVTYTYDNDGGNPYVLWSDGSCGNSIKIENVERVGEHFDTADLLLQALKRVKE